MRIEKVEELIVISLSIILISTVILVVLLSMKSTSILDKLFFMR